MDIELNYMEKQELLQELKSQYEQKLIKREEALAVFDEASAIATDKKATVSHLLYYLGAAIVVFGIAILIGQNWQNLNAVSRVVATLGAGIASFVVGVILRQDEKLSSLDQAFFFISSMVTPIGISVVFDVAGYSLSSLHTQMVISGILSLMYLFSFVVLRNSLFIVFAVIYLTAFFYIITNYLFVNNPQLIGLHFNEYRTLAVGLSYIFLGHYFAPGARRGLTGPLYGFGVLAFLGAVFALTGWSPRQNLFWELIFPFVDFGVIFLSLKLKSKSFLVFGSIFLIAYILKLTVEYFSKSLGWPLALVIVGFAIIGVGYLTFFLNQRYLKEARK